MGRQFSDVGELKNYVVKEWNSLNPRLLYDLKKIAVMRSAYVVNLGAKISY